MHTGQPYSEHELISRVKRGDRDAQYILYRQYVDAMYHTVIRMVNNQADAQDIVQDSFIKVFEKIRSYRADATLGAWIKRIAINTAINALRKKKRSPEYADDKLTEVGEPIEVDIPPFVKSAQIHEAIKALPSGCRNVVNLYVFEGYSHKEIAEILDVTESTSKTQFRRGKALLRVSLAEKIYENEA